jgi:hypothetical protein
MNFARDSIEDQGGTHGTVGFYVTAIVLTVFMSCQRDVQRIPEGDRQR